MKALEDLPLQLRDEISHFFSICKTPEGKVVKVDGWFALQEALAEIDAAQRRWSGHRAPSQPSATS
jgi:inorganic pyrophosphatase